MKRLASINCSVPDKVDDHAEMHISSRMKI
jgi:hypothetical protein